MIIDFHHHAFPPGSPVKPWNLAQDKEDALKAGITKIYLSCPLKTDHTTAHELNTFLYETVKNETMYEMLGSLPFDDIESALSEINYVLDECKGKGFCMNTHNDSIYLSDDYLDPLFEELNRRKSLVFIHPNHFRAPGNNKILTAGNDSVYEYTFDTTRALLDFVLKDKVRKYSDINFILPHCGGTIPFIAHRVSVSGKWGCTNRLGDDIMKDLKSFYYDLALNHCDINYEFMKSFVGCDHLVYGSDYPNSGTSLLSEDLQTFKQTDVFDEEEKKKIFYENSKLLTKEYLTIKTRNL